jgi:hypothetical protein
MIKYRKGYKYQLAEDYECRTRIGKSGRGGYCQTDYLVLDETESRLLIRRGYAWDGASGPTFDTKSSMRGSLEHDAKHQLIRLGLVDRHYLPVVDREFQKTLLDDGMWRLRVFLWIWALHTPLASKARPSNEQGIHLAP